MQTYFMDLWIYIIGSKSMEIIGGVWLWHVVMYKTALNNGISEESQFCFVSHRQGAKNKL